MSTNHTPEAQPSLTNGTTTGGKEVETDSVAEKYDGLMREKYKPRFVDIGINLTDNVYSGLYHGKQAHPSDMYEVIERAKSVGCSKLIVTGSDVEHSRRALGLSEVFPGSVYATVGIHPCSSAPFGKKDEGAKLLGQLKELAEKSGSGIVAFGEIGLDYDRLSHCGKETQIVSFNAQLDLFASLTEKLQRPLFLHSRAAHEDFVGILKERIAKGELKKRGVVHSFTGTVEEMKELVEIGFDIGVNGCSLKTEENCAVVKEIPLARLQLETDGPWCEMRPSHAGTTYAAQAGFVEKVSVAALGHSRSQAKDGGWKWVKKEKFTDGALVKGRNESCLIERVAWAVAGIKGVGVQEVAEKAWGNSVRMFGLDVVAEGSLG